MYFQSAKNRGEGGSAPSIILFLQKEKSNGLKLYAKTKCFAKRDGGGVPYYLLLRLFKQYDALERKSLLKSCCKCLCKSYIYTVTIYHIRNNDKYPDFGPQCGSGFRTSMRIRISDLIADPVL